MRDGDGAAAADSAVSRRPRRIPAEFRDQLGRVTVAKTVPELKKFVENGGTVLTIGSSTALGYHLGLPIRDALVERVRRRRAAAAAREVLRARARFSRRASTTRSRSPTAWTSARCLLRREPGVPAAARGRAEGREAGGVVRRRRRCAAAGRGASSISIRRCRSSRRRSARATSCCSAPRSLARPAARHVQAAVQRHLLRQRRRQRRRGRPTAPASGTHADVVALRTRMLRRSENGTRALTGCQAGTAQSQRLWTVRSDGPCLLVERDDAPRRNLRRAGDDVLRQTGVRTTRARQMLARPGDHVDRRADDHGDASAIGDQRSATELRRRDEVVEVPPDDFLDHDVGMFLAARRRRRSRSARDRRRG